MQQNASFILQACFINHAFKIDNFQNCVYVSDDMDFCYFDHQIIKDIAPMWVGWLYPYDSVIQPLFDKFTFKAIYGIRKIQDRYSYVNYDCRLHKDFHSVNFAFVTVLFYLLILGIIISLMVLFIEKCFKLSSQ